MTNTKLLKADEVAEILDVKNARVYELVRSKKLDFVLVGTRQYRFSLTAIQNFINRGGNQAQAEREDYNHE